MFVPYSNDKGALQPWEYLEAAEGSYEIGQLLEISVGQLTAIADAHTSVPGYVCMGKKTVAAGDLLPVQRITEDVIFETTLSATSEDAVFGAKLQVSASGKQVDAAAEGSFEVVYIEGIEAGSIVRGRFTK